MKERLAADFDRAASIMACWSKDSVNPQSLNPYRSQAKKDNYRVDEIERSYRVHKMGGRHIEQTISASQVIHDA